MKILYIYRSTGPSIRRVFEPIENELFDLANIDHINLPYNRMIDFWKNMRYIFRFLKATDYDIIHITGDVYYTLIPLFVLQKKKKFKTVVTVHDLGHYTQHKHTFMHFIYYWLWIKPIKLSNFVTFISEKSFEEGQSLLNIRGNRVSVILNSYKEEYMYSPPPHNEKPRILHVGTGPNKNLEKVVKALNGIPCHLRIIKKLNERQLELLKENCIDYSNVYNISDDQMLEEYKLCDVVSFPSLYEGFGMPIIEGQAVGRVVVTSDREPMKSIAGDGSVLVNPEDVIDIKNGFLTAINNSKCYVEKGLENCKRFSPKIIAKQYYEIYKNLI